MEGVGEEICWWSSRPYLVSTYFDLEYFIIKRPSIVDGKPCKSKKKHSVSFLRMLSSAVNGITIAKGTQIQMPIWASHHNEEFFPEPEAFKPG